MMAPVAVCVAATLGLLLAEARQSSLGKWLTKPVAAGAYLWLALASGAPGTRFGRLMLLGLVLCWLGDVLLIPERRPGWFRAGIASFLLGHVAFTTACASQPLSWLVLAVATVAMAAFGWSVLRWLRPHLTPDFVIPVHAYVVVICATAVAALAMVGGGGPLTVAVGALAFVASDVSVARDRFVSPGFANRAWGLPLYFAAQLLFASTAGSGLYS
jgi:uncharacterized membrane protein YhhN